MKHGRFIRDRLPTPPTYFDSIGLQLHGRGTWRSALCPFHDDQQPSLRVCEWRSETADIWRRSAKRSFVLRIFS